MKNKKNRLTNLLKIGALLFGFSLLLCNCEKDEVLIENPTKSDFAKEKIEAVTLEKLPENLLDKVFSVSKKASFKSSSKLSRKQLLTTYFEPSANVVTTETGFTTYSLIIKKDVDINRFLKKNVISKKSYRNECSEPSGGGDSSGFDVIALNSKDSNGGSSTGLGNPTHVSFNNINGSILGVTFTNINTGITTTNYSNLNNTGNWNVFNGIWTGIKGIGNTIVKGIESITGWIGGLFKSNRTSKCPGGLARGDDDDKDVKDVKGCSGQIAAKQDARLMSLNEFEDKHLLDKNEALDIPLPKELLEPKTLQNRNSKAVTTEDFDCACEKDNPFTIAEFLKLEFEQMLFLSEDDQKYLRKEICEFVKKNGYSDKAKFWGKGQTYLEEAMNNIPWKASVGILENNPNLKHTHVAHVGVLSYFKMEDGSIIAASTEEHYLSKSGDLKDLYPYEASGSGYAFFYIKLSENDLWAEMLINPRNHSDELRDLFQLAGKELGKNLGRYVLPIEDIKILIDGKDFDGAKVAKWKAAGGILLTVVPGLKGLKAVDKIADGVKAWKVVIKNGSKTYTRVVRELSEETLKHFDNYAPGTSGLIKEALKTGKYVDTVINDTAEIIVDVSNKLGRKLSWPEVKALFKRGTDFNKTASRIYEYNEVVLATRKRLDTYIPGVAIISRKATTLSNIKPATFKSCLLYTSPSPRD